MRSGPCPDVITMDGVHLGVKYCHHCLHPLTKCKCVMPSGGSSRATSTGGTTFHTTRASSGPATVTSTLCGAQMAGNSVPASTAQFVLPPSSQMDFPFFSSADQENPFEDPFKEGDEEMDYSTSGRATPWTGGMHNVAPTQSPSPIQQARPASTQGSYAGAVQSSGRERGILGRVPGYSANMPPPPPPGFPPQQAAGNIPSMGRGGGTPQQSRGRSQERTRVPAKRDPSTASYYTKSGGATKPQGQPASQGQVAPQGWSTTHGGSASHGPSASHGQSTSRGVTAPQSTTTPKEQWSPPKQPQGVSPAPVVDLSIDAGVPQRLRGSLKNHG